MKQIAVAVVECEGKVLIGQRPAGVPLAGLWEFPGGKVEPGETAAQAAARECREETGLDVLVGEEFPSVTHDYEHGRVELHFFRCRLRHTSQTPYEPFRWVYRDELAQYPFPHANHEILNVLRKDAAIAHSSSAMTA